MGNLTGRKNILYDMAFMVNLTGRKNISYDMALMEEMEFVEPLNWDFGHKIWALHNDTFLACLNEVQEELLYYPWRRCWRRCWRRR